MSEEDAFLRKLLEQPNNDLTRLVYADWLDEQGTAESTAKAEFLRLIADAELIGKLTERVRELAKDIDSDWLAAVGKLPIENCHETKEPEVRVNGLGVEFFFECPKRWEELTPTDEGTGVRFCGACHKTVHFCSDASEVRRHANLGNCVAVELHVPRRPDDLEPDFSSMMMGMIAFDPPPEPEEPRRSWWSRLWGRR